MVFLWGGGDTTTRSLNFRKLFDDNLSIHSAIEMRLRQMILRGGPPLLVVDQVDGMHRCECLVLLARDEQFWTVVPSPYCRRVWQ